jgi:hypothetical protein
MLESASQWLFLQKRSRATCFYDICIFDKKRMVEITTDIIIVLILQDNPTIINHNA